MGPGQTDRLCVALAEQLQVPLLQIARQAELSRRGTSKLSTESTFEQMETASQAALRLLDAYLLSARVNAEQVPLGLEATSVSAVLHDAAHTLTPFAKHYNCELTLSLGGRYGPVMAHPKALEHALTSLGYMLIETSGASGKRRPGVLLAAHRSRSGIVAGAFGELDGLQASLYRRAKALLGRAHQPLATISASSSAGLFIADTLFSAMYGNLQVARHDGRVGFGATLVPSHQIALL